MQPPGSASGSGATKKGGGAAGRSDPLDFLTNNIDEQELHQRGKQKKHEADNEKDKVKRTACYMEAVCYFCLCAISQYRLKKLAPNPVTNKSSMDLLNETFQFLKYVNDKIAKAVDNDMFAKKFRVLS